MKAPLYHLPAIAIIESLQLPAYGTIEKPGSAIHQIEAKMELYGKGFSISWRDNYSSVQRKQFKLGRTLRKVGFKINEFDLLFEDVYINSHRTSEDGPVISAVVGYFKKKKFNLSNTYYYRLVIPLQKKLNMHYQIQRSVFSSDIVHSSAEGTTGTIKGDALQVCLTDHNEKYYLIIESGTKQTFASFSDKAYAVKNAIGYLTGYLAGDAGYYFAYNKPDLKIPLYFYFNEWRNTINSSYHPVNANPLAYHKNKATEIFYKKGLLRAVSLSEFSSLCQKLYDSKEFTAIVILILEASIASLVLMPGAFAIALESMAELITNPIKEKIAPIKEPSLGKNVRAVCSEFIKTACANLPSEDLKVLLGRIERINEVMNKSRLRVPFQLLNIKLSTADLDTIETRNAFLHGRIPDITGAWEKRSEKREGLDQYYASMRLYTLLNRLILKWVDYDNYVINHAKIQERATLIKLKEPYYIKD